MFTNKIILRAAGPCLAAAISLAAQPLKAQTSAESKRIEQLEPEVAELRREVSGNIHAQQARFRSATFTADKVTDQIANEVITSYTRVQSLAGQIATAKQSLSDAAEALRLAQERKEFGVGVVLEMILAQQELSRVRNDYLNIVTDYNKAQYALLRAVGRLPAPLGR